ncbi:polynucleotide adenylyltransferase [Staphylococcus aureus A6224]|nr:Polynucleotide adenylyltransferase region [Staphylococcus aureus subsp. aureus JH9]EEV27799.1 polynucleotide adenylyltransferase [Staphylococcus aureus A9781]EEV64328.1 polynucleotide adenylyltransferase [Staphylococcus aureus A9763]EEV67952.1 tRNA CCA-pyrophosphorylase [Staphylococcus aureus A9719]EEV73912.1 polynucleotide adenylyltransferase region [Staphylococcus aureus A9299]EEV74237.1 polynucleotide adenylyltransferase region [Staphylococcus aureus A8115]EEV76525.1 polynucleotide aden
MSITKVKASNNMDKSLFEQARPILEQIQDNGFEAYYVGGSVRDYVMGRNIHDIDITTSATPDEIESIFSHTIPVGKEHGTINVVFNDENYEVTTFRAEEDYVDHRRPSGVTFVRDLYEDLQRRDFTMNAIAMDTAYKLYDYFDGQQDINNRIIRTVGIAEERFQEDALRMIRCLRFQSQLSFDIAMETFEAMRTQMADIKFLSIERIVIELTKLMRGINVEESFNHLKSLKAFNYMPYFEQLDMNQINVTEPIDLELLIAIVSVKFDINYSLKPLKLSNRQVKDINQYIQIMNALPSIITKEQLKMFVYDYDTNLIKNVMVAADVLKANDIQGHEPLIVNLQTIDETLHRLPMHNRKDMMVNGGVLMAHLNAKSGPWLKDVLRQIEIAIVTGKVSNEETEILKWVDNHVKI